MENKNVRLMSLDALRGFDMLFIMGFSGLIAAVCRLWSSPVSDVIARQMSHVPWDGLTHHDTIFPLFLFLAGISFPFSLANQQRKGMSSLLIHQKIIKRGIILVFLGCVYNGFFQFNFETLRVASVLGRIGLAWMFAALIYLHFGKKARAGIIVFILVGYWLLLRFVPAPDMPGASPFSFEGNLVGYIDRLFLPGRLLSRGMFDPEGLLSTVPAICTALLGMFAGELVRSDNPDRTPARKAGLLALAGVVLCLVGWGWSYAFPINKALWSSTFVCVVGGYSFLIFALFYYVIDVRGSRSWVFPLQIIGMNSITIYLAQQIINFNQVSKFFLGGVASLFPDGAGDVILRAGYVAACWLFLWFLYKKNVFLKV